MVESGPILGNEFVTVRFKKYGTEGVEQRIVRRKVEGTTTVSAASCLSPDQVDSLLQVARSLSQLTDEQELFNLLSERLEGKPLNPDEFSGAWNELACELMDSKYQELSQSQHFSQEEIKELIQSIYVTATRIEYSQKSDHYPGQFYSFYEPYGEENPHQGRIISVCAGSKIAKEWFGTAISVFNRLQRKLPESFDL